VNKKHWGEVPEEDKIMCPKCGMNTGRVIWYGMPSSIEHGRIYGGCCILLSIA
jgi:hypothetical protein